MNSLLGTCRRSPWASRTERSPSEDPVQILWSINQISKTLLFQLLSRDGSHGRGDFVSLMFGMTACKGVGSEF